MKSSKVVGSQTMGPSLYDNKIVNMDLINKYIVNHHNYDDRHRIMNDDHG